MAEGPACTGINSFQSKVAFTEYINGLTDLATFKVQKKSITPASGQTGGNLKKSNRIGGLPTEPIILICDAKGEEAAVIVANNFSNMITSHLLPQLPQSPQYDMYVTLAALAMTAKRFAQFTPLDPPKLDRYVDVSDNGVTHILTMLPLKISYETQEGQTEKAIAIHTHPITSLKSLVLLWDENQHKANAMMIEFGDYSMRIERIDIGNNDHNLDITLRIFDGDQLNETNEHKEMLELLNDAGPGNALKRIQITTQFVVTNDFRVLDAFQTLIESFLPKQLEQGGGKPKSRQSVKKIVPKKKALKPKIPAKKK
jgi:hypothetical protein